jgi:transcriptional regulator with XRE-family HTH domain
MPADVTERAAARRRRLAQRRKALGLTQEALAELLTVERSTVVRWERGESEPQPVIRPRLARALRVSADQLETLLSKGDQHALRAPRQLPAEAAFAGRTAELTALTGFLDANDAGTPGTVMITAISGPARVGKTALAVHWAHQVADRFPGGQLHVNLHGFGPAGAAMTPGAALRQFLDGLGVAADRIPADQAAARFPDGQLFMNLRGSGPGDENPVARAGAIRFLLCVLRVPSGRIPADPGAREGLYRSLLAGKRMLIVLDSARDEQQVRPLLPASPRSLVLVTSRHQLTGLAACDGARLLSIDVLTPGEARAMLTARIGAARAEAEPGAIAEIASLCGGLPLALAAAAAGAEARPGFPLAALADELRDAAGRVAARETAGHARSL